MAARPLLWSPAHPAVIDHDGHAFHRLWCPDLRYHDGCAGTIVTPEHALLWEDAPRACTTCRAESVRRIED